MTDVEADPNGGIWVGTYEGFARSTYNVDPLQPRQYRNARHRLSLATWRDVQAMDLSRSQAIKAALWPYTGGVEECSTGRLGTHYTPNNSPLTHWQVVAVEFDGERQSVG